MMNKRTFLKHGALLAGTTWLSSAIGFATPLRRLFMPVNEEFTLPNLPYDFAALQPYIDEATMRVHHGKHHAGYVSNLNKAVMGTAFAGLSIRQIMTKLGAADTAIRNNGGGHYNHTLFWKILTPTKGTKPSEELATAINASFGSMEAMKEQLMQAAKSRFGSGWAWVAVDKNGKLFISSTPNQDNPLMYKIAEQPGYPILGIDVWEHAYYLQYKNLRADYLEAVWQILNWEEISKQFRTGNHPFILWQELDEFHNIMSSTFHPMEEGDLAPIKTRSAELAAKAKALHQADIPSRFNTDAVQAAVKKLRKDSASLHQIIQKGTDDATITGQLTALHDVFHSIIGLCMDEEH